MGVGGGDGGMTVAVGGAAVALDRGVGPRSGERVTSGVGGASVICTAGEGSGALRDVASGSVAQATANKDRQAQSRGVSFRRMGR